MSKTLALIIVGDIDLKLYVDSLLLFRILYFFDITESCY